VTESPEQTPPPEGSMPAGAGLPDPDVVDAEILEGDLVDSDGTRFGPGDFVSYAPGTHHSSRTEGGCLIAVFEWVPPAA